MVYELYINGVFKDEYLSLMDLFDNIQLIGLSIVDEEEHLSEDEYLVKVYCETI